VRDLGQPLGGLWSFLAGPVLGLWLRLSARGGEPLADWFFPRKRCLWCRGKDFHVDGDYRLAGGPLQVQGSAQDARTNGVDRDIECLGCLVHTDPVI